MSQQTETKKERSYTVHFVTGKSMNIKAAEVKIDAKENRVYFLNADGQPADERIYILSGIVVIEPTGESGTGSFRI